MPHDVFLSHSAQDSDAADAVCAGLEAAGIRVWMAPRDIVPGMEWGAAIVAAISACRALVLILSARSNASKQVLREVERAVSKGIPIVPVRIENVQASEAMEYYISAPHWLDATAPPIERHVERIVASVRMLIGISEPPAPARPVPNAAPAVPAEPVPPVDTRPRVPCPACAEYVLVEAKRCWRCGTDLTTQSAPATSSVTATVAPGGPAHSPEVRGPSRQHESTREASRVEPYAAPWSPHARHTSDASDARVPGPAPTSPGSGETRVVKVILAVCVLLIVVLIWRSFDHRLEVAPAADTTVAATDTAASPTPLMPTPTTTASSAAITGDIVEVRMIGDAFGYRFDPANVTVKKGDGVKFTMVSGGPHNVAFDEAGIPAGSAAQLDANMSDKMAMLSSNMKTNPGDAITVSFANLPAGTYNYHCTPHLAMGMKGTITVQ
jgi:plastocyanin